MCQENLIGKKRQKVTEICNSYFLLVKKLSVNKKMCYKEITNQKIHNHNFDSDSEKTQKIKLLQKSQNQIMTTQKLKM